MGSALTTSPAPREMTNTAAPASAARPGPRPSAATGRRSPRQHHEQGDAQIGPVFGGTVGKMVGHRGQVMRGEPLERVGDHRSEEVGPVALGGQLDGAPDRAGAPEGEPQRIGRADHGRSRRPCRPDGQEPEVGSELLRPNRAASSRPIVPITMVEASTSLDTKNWADANEAEYDTQSGRDDPAASPARSSSTRNISGGNTMKGEIQVACALGDLQGAEAEEETGHEGGRRQVTDQQAGEEVAGRGRRRHGQGDEDVEGRHRPPQPGHGRGQQAEEDDAGVGEEIDPEGMVGVLGEERIEPVY